MESRFKTLMAVLEQEKAPSQNSPQGTGSVGSISSTDFPTGWRLGSANSWKPCPIGVYVEC